MAGLRLPEGSGILAGQSRGELLEAITVHARGLDEELAAFLTAFDAEVARPCSATLLEIDTTEITALAVEDDFLA